ncbi:PREDICTED: (E)-beta-ocimene synthase, chloroplastic-like isoform X2 [Tarenaya hassleriana]|uniref:(E)-beta-ocimene synthase, chloroplastic-like isoform X2 n=1 Tax=Tarenaya hassleriana TaxID=28532 RepID=UPI00053CA8B5|nr:PREDICTED: (E)-beta-ocimene synthase, chloroplastic-like isoform X2 [Tarenaya hassleriana]
MASLWLGSPLIYRNAPCGATENRRRTPQRFVCPVVAKTTSAEAAVVRRSANYQPSHWDQNCIHLLQNEYAMQSNFQERAKLLKEDVRKTLHETEGPLKQLELIDTLQRLGVSHHFDHGIENILKEIYAASLENERMSKKTEDLHTTALQFRLLRQHGFNVSEVLYERDGSFREVGA